ncbi:hypothetical protein MRX96_016994 [Rhipicephalus microplus]
MPVGCLVAGLETGRMEEWQRVQLCLVNAAGRKENQPGCGEKRCGGWDPESNGKREGNEREDPSRSSDAAVFFLRLPDPLSITLSWVRAMIATRLRHQHETARVTPSILRPEIRRPTPDSCVMLQMAEAVTQDAAVMW